METMPDVIILRGLPGVGKTTIANFLAERLASENGAVVLSSYDFFMSKDGEFIFDKTKIQAAHKWNFERFKQAVAKQLSPIIIDNSNIQRFHYYHYVDYAQRHDYRVSILTLPHNNLSDKELEVRTPHKLNRNAINKMRKTFVWEM